MEEKSVSSEIEIDIKRIIYKRGGIRSALTKLTNKIESLINDQKLEVSDKIEKLKDCKLQLLDKSSVLKSLDFEIQNVIKLEDLEADILSSEEYSENIIKFEQKIARFVSLNTAPLANASEINQITLQQPSSPTRSLIKLPKLAIAKFFGEYSKWVEFFDQFESAIHSNDSLSKVDKFNYLRSLCGGPALTSITGLSLTSDNYDIAIKILKDRYGRRDLIINSHMNQLLNLEPVKSLSNLVALRNLYDTCEVNVRCLKNLKIETSSWQILNCILIKLIPQDLVLEYNRRRKSRVRFDVDELLEFLKSEIEFRELTMCLSNKKPSVLPVTVNKTFGNRFGNSEFSNRKSVTSFSTSLKNVCVFCKGNHEELKCKNVTVDDKIRKLKSERRCLKCFKKFHFAYQCKVVKFPCNKCLKHSHHESICVFVPNMVKVADSETVEKEEGRNSEVLAASSVSSLNSHNVFLQTCGVIAESGSRSRLVRVLLDSGSQKSFITRKLAFELKLCLQKSQPVHVFGFGGEAVSFSSVCEVARLKLCNRFDPFRNIKISGLVVNQITNVLIPVPCEWLKSVAYSRGFELADNGAVKTIDILLGCDFLSEVMTENCIRISKRLLAVETIFGYAIQGVSGSDTPDSPIAVNLSCVEFKDDLKKLWDLEAIGIKSRDEISLVDSEVLDRFENTIKKRSGRYETRLLWNSESREMNNNYYVAEKRLTYLLRTLERKPKLFNEYDQIINEQLKDNVIEPCELDPSKTNSFYLPHRPVVRVQNESTRVRIIYDGSSKAKNEISLNDCLLSGPNLNPELLEVILNFRKHVIGVCADIERAFLQISIAVEDRDYLRFLWVDEQALCNGTVSNFKCFRFTRVPFGITCSPFLLSATIRHHLKYYEKQYSEACAMLKRLYVDDLIYSVDTVQDAFDLSRQAVKIMSEASMNLKKWASNSDELRKLWGEERLHLRPSLQHSADLKVLGMKWFVHEDSLGLDLEAAISNLESVEATKRGILQTVAKVYDPLGMVAPFTITMKCLIQDLWKSGLDWDEKLPPDLVSRFEEWCADLPDIVNVNIPRWHGIPGSKESFQICIFSDASPRAYGAVAYLRAKDSNVCTSSFILSKTRVAPLKKLSLPRLELMGAVIAARIAKYLENSLKVNGEDILLFTDSEICLHWIKSAARVWKPFVSNRVSEIQENTSPQNWYFCKGTENPADLLTRGIKPSAFLHNESWWKGPEWLSRPPDSWRSHALEIDSEEINMERRPKVELVCVVLKNESDDILCRFSSWMKLIRVLSWCLRFCQPTSRSKGFLTTDELNKASRIVFKIVQENEFPEEVRALKSGKFLKSSSRIISLNPFLDTDGIMRVGGRLNKADIPEDQKHPIIMPKKHFITRLLIKHFHEIHLHGGISLVHSALRQKFWIINARESIRSCIWKCVKCHRFRSETATQLMGELPRSRVTQSRVFSRVGIDFAGPFILKARKGRGGQTMKSYVCLFVCFAVKAVHLEMVSDLSSEAFIACLRRFASRRGKPNEIYCDCGTNFVGASRELKRLVSLFRTDESFHGYVTSENICWKFNPPGAPHQGGLWEAGVKAMKHHLRRTIGSQILSVEEFLTLINQVEACLNSRPVVPISSDPNDLTALTPGHFIIGLPLTAIPDQRLADVKVSTLKRWQMIQRMFQDFWRRWSNDYLTQLNQRNKWRRVNVNLKVNDLVLIRDDNQPPLKWKLGRILQVYPGADNKVRVVRLKTAEGELKRPIVKLSHLPE